MKSIVAVALLASSFGVVFGLAHSTAAGAAAMVDTYDKGTYRYICIMQKDTKYCGNWIVVK